MPAKNPVALIGTKQEEKEDDVFKFECEHFHLSCSFECMIQCKSCHIFCGSCGVQNATNCSLCVPPPKEEDPECSICVEKVPFVDMVACMHDCLFCSNCLKQNVQTGLGNNKSKTNCMNFTNCGGLFSLAMFEKALSPGTAKAMGQRQYHVVVSRVAGLWPVLQTSIGVCVFVGSLQLCVDSPFVPIFSIAIGAAL